MHRYTDIIDHLPGFVRHGKNQCILISDGPLMVNYLGDSTVCISGIKEEEYEELFSLIHTVTGFTVKDECGTTVIEVPLGTRQCGDVARILDASMHLMEAIDRT